MNFHHNISNVEKAIIESIESALSTFPDINKNNLYSLLKKNHNLKPEEIGRNFEAFNDALTKVAGRKKYAVQREIIRILNSRAISGEYTISAEAEAYLRISKVLLEDSEKQVTKSETRVRLVDYTIRLNRLLHENKENIEKLKKSERLAAIGETAAMVGHDLRNPLQSIIGEVYIAKAELKQMPDDEQKKKMQESLDFISEQIHYMNKIVNDLQTFVADLKAYKRLIKLKQLIISTVAQVIIPENIEVTLQVEDNFALETDPELLKRAMDKLADKFDSGNAPRRKNHNQSQKHGQ